MSLIPLGFWAASGGGAEAGSYDLLETEILTSTQASVTFSSLGDYSADYQHLQIRMVCGANSGSGSTFVNVAFNSVGGTSYAWHRLQGNGSSASSFGTSNQADAEIERIGINNFGAIIADIFDPFESTKNTTMRALGGYAGERVSLNSVLFNDSSALTNIELDSGAGSFIIGSRFSLYGLRAA